MYQNKENENEPMSDYSSKKGFTLTEMMFVVLIIAGLLVVMSRIYKTNMEYETAHQIDDFVKSIDKALFVANTTLQNSSFKYSNTATSGVEGDNGGLYLMVPNTDFNSIYNALTKGDCMIECFDNIDTNNSQCGGNTADFSGMCRVNGNSQTLCLMNVFDKNYLNSYLIPKIIQGKIYFRTQQMLNPNYVAIKDIQNRTTMQLGQLIKLNDISVDLSDDPNIIGILQNIDNKYRVSGNTVTYPLNNGAGHFVIVRNGYICQ
jgi:prepilin-type N-terminal cleavage/methylation domain-containing protein